MSNFLRCVSQPFRTLPKEYTPGGRIIRFSGKKNIKRAVSEGLPEVYPRLWRYALVIAGNRDAAADLAQAAALRAIEKAHLFEPGSNLDRWVFRIAQRIWLNELRAQAVRRGGGLLPVEDTDLPDGGPDVETNIFARQVLMSVYALPEAQRACVMLVYVEGFTYAEAAEILDVPRGTIMSRLAAARKTVGAQMSPSGSKLERGVR